MEKMKSSLDFVFSELVYKVSWQMYGTLTPGAKSYFKNSGSNKLNLRL